MVRRLVQQVRPLVVIDFAPLLLRGVRNLDRMGDLVAQVMRGFDGESVRARRRHARHARYGRQSLGEAFARGFDLDDMRAAEHVAHQIEDTAAEARIQAAVKAAPYLISVTN